MRLLLKMKIIDRYGTQRRFSKEIDRSEYWLSLIVCGVREPSQAEKILIAGKLGVENVNDLFIVK